MQRRTFLKTSAASIGTITGLLNGMLGANARGFNQQVRAAAGFAEAGGAGQPVWGINSVVLGPPLASPPSLESLIDDRKHVSALDQFYCVGTGYQATPTKCRVAYDDKTLFIALYCTESDMAFPYANLDKDLWPEANWDSLYGLPSGAASSWPPYPDEADVLIQSSSDASTFFQFAAIPQGMAFGCKRVLCPGIGASADETAAVPGSAKVSKVDAFATKITREGDGWRVLFQIPWETLGGKPKTSFGFLPMRTRWRNGEFSSPVALDFNESMPIDLLVEAYFSAPAQSSVSQDNLYQFPSGMLRWQKPVMTNYPGIETRQEIWRMQSSLAVPTGRSNLAERLRLVQSWMDLMTLEGFTPLRTGWALLTDDLTLTFIRQKVNAAFKRNDLKTAYGLLDSYLHRFSNMSGWWYADGSPGDISSSDWKQVSSVSSLKAGDTALTIQCTAGGHLLDLHIALPKSGGVRLYCDDGGYWRPDGLLPLKTSQSPGISSIETPDGAIRVQKEPFAISMYDIANKKVVEIRGEDLAFRFGPDGKIRATDFRHSLDKGEVIYGFGEQYDRFDQNGNTLTLWGTDDTIGNGKGLANATYKQLPIFHSSKSYMVFVNSSYRLRADIGRTNPGQYRLTQEGPVFDYYFWIGTPEKVLHSYTGLTGKPLLPPKWAFEPWIGRGSEAWAGGQLKDSLAWGRGELRQAVDEEKRVIERFAELDIPHSAIYAEGPSALSNDLNQFLAPRGIRTLGYFRPRLGPKRQRLLMPNLPPAQLPILHCETEEETDRLSYVDFTNPNALELCRQATKLEADMKVAGSMVDFGDWVPDDAVFYDGRRGSEMHNVYSYGYHRTISEIYKERRGDDFILYARAAAPGTQKWVGQFAGDHPANFNGLKHVLTGALNLCACGYSTWGSDIGGYFGFPQPAVYMRWVQFGCFSPLMRPHGIAPREPWHFGEAAVTNYKFLAWTRENLLNYIYNAAVAAHETGFPIMRSMPVAFPGDPQAAAVSDQYMFGSDLLVAPVVDENVSRTVLFPPGVWTSLWDGKTISGHATLKVDAPLDTIPVYLRPGAIVPVQMSHDLQFGKSMSGGRVNALVVTVPDGERTASFLNVNDGAAKVTASPGAGGSTWMLDKLSDVSHVLVYGTAAASAVKVNGKVLPGLGQAKANPEQAGWRADAVFNRLVIRLPQRSAEQSEPALKLEVVSA